MKFFCITLAIGMLFLTACAPKTVEPLQKADSSVTERQLSSDQDESARRGVTSEDLARAERERLLRQQQSGAESSESSAREIGFDYDSYTIKPTEFPKLDAMGNYLKQNRDAKLAVEGHCDERGTIDYNFALGQKRAEAVKTYLTKMGIDADRVRTISFGKEVPVDPGHTEQSWAKNRRAYMKVEGRG